MQLHGFARAGWGILAVALLMPVGCRSSSTDRMRVLEAKKSDAEARLKDMQIKNSEIRAEELQALSEAEQARARNEMLAREIALLREQRAQAQPRKVQVDVGGLRDIPGVTVVDREGGGSAIVLASDVTFRAGKADLNEKALAALARVAKALRTSEGIRKVRVEGHTDSDPIKHSGWKGNGELSRARADSVRRFLVAQGINESLLTAEGHGADRPVASNASQEGKARNRRVEIVLLGR